MGARCFVIIACLGVGRCRPVRRAGDGRQPCRRRQTSGGGDDRKRKRKTRFIDDEAEQSGNDDTGGSDSGSDGGASAESSQDDSFVVSDGHVSVDGDAVNLMEAKQNFGANAAAIKTEQKMQKSLLDIKV